MIPIRRNNLPVLVQKHYEALENFISLPSNSFSIEALDSEIQAVLPRENFESVVKANHQKIEAIASFIGKIGTSKFEVFKKLHNLLKEKQAFYLLDEHNIKSYYHFGSMLESLQVAVCPYTNRFFIQNSVNKIPQFDPFYPLNEYPYLGLSFLNLIPCSKESIRQRSGKKLGVSPYDTSFPFQDIKFVLKLKKDNWVYNQDAVEIELDLSLLEEDDKEAFLRNLNVFQLKELYQLNKNVVLNKIQQFYIHPPSYLDSLFITYGNKVFPSRSAMNPQESRGFSLFDDDLKHPLSKLNKDIFQLIND